MSTICYILCRKCHLKTLKLITLLYCFRCKQIISIYFTYHNVLISILLLFVNFIFQISMEKLENTNTMRSYDLELSLLLYMLCFLTQIFAFTLNMEKLISATKTCLSLEHISQVNLVIGPNDDEEQYLEICQKSLFIGFKIWYLFNKSYF